LYSTLSSTANELASFLCLGLILGNSTLSWKDHKKQEQEKLVALGANFLLASGFSFPCQEGTALAL
jgi:hypothetical protein